MSEDRELAALSKMVMLFEGLSADERQRSLRYLAERFEIGQTANAVQNLSRAPDSKTFETFADLFEASAPGNDKEKALVGAYWFQVIQGNGEFAAGPVNSELKNLGIGLSNIAESLRRCSNDKPATVMQIRKSGSSQQARKAYRLTQPGIRKVETMIASPSQEGEEGS